MIRNNTDKHNNNITNINNNINQLKNNWVVTSLLLAYCSDTFCFLESRAYSESKINSLFEKYKDESEDCILSEGIEEFCIDLQLKPDEFKVLGKYIKHKALLA